MTLPEKVRELVARDGGVKQASAKWGIPMTTISHLANNPSHDPRLSTIHKIAAAAGKKTSELLKEIEEEGPQVRTSVA